jgi:hypothetical protein
MAPLREYQLPLDFVVCGGALVGFLVLFFTGYGALLVGTVARSRTASLEFARFATTGAEPCLCPGAMFCGVQ